MNYPLQAMVQLGVVPPVTFPTDSRYYGFGVQQYTAPNGPGHSLSARRIVPQPGAPNYATINQYTRAAGRPARPDRRQIPRRSADGLADLRRQRRDTSLRSGRDAGHGAGDHHAAGRAGRLDCSVAFN